MNPNALDGRSVLAKAWQLVALALFLALSSCAGHTAQTKSSRTALDAGNPRQALAFLNEKLEVDSERQVPDDFGGDQALLLLDRAMVLQQLAEFEHSSRDLQIADKQIEVLDLSRKAVDDIGKYLFSDDVGPYKAPAYEKLMINTINMMNYLVRGDLSGGRIEARRLAVMQKYIEDYEDPADALSGPGSYLAGFIFEKSGEFDAALRYYDEALAYGDYRSLHDPIRRLAPRTSYRSPRIRKILEQEETPETERQGEGDGELLVMVNFGRVPAKIAKRVPIGLALTYASGILSPHDINRANYLAAQGLVTWVNYPDLEKNQVSYGQPAFALAGRWQSLEGIIAIDQETRRAWEQTRGVVVASAITRMLSRVVAGEAIRQSVGKKQGLLGAVLSLGTQATLSALDTPDTRSWATLPARIAFGRVRVTPGTHEIILGARGVRRRIRLTVQPGGWAAGCLTVLN